MLNRNYAFLVVTGGSVADGLTVAVTSFVLSMRFPVISYLSSYACRSSSIGGWKGGALEPV